MDVKERIVTGSQLGSDFFLLDPQKLFFQIRARICIFLV